MPTEKRSRGRPVGSGKKDDPYLARVADALLADPKLKPSAAMKRIILTRVDQSEQDGTLLRRLQGKWKKTKAQHLMAAQKRLDDRQSPRVTIGQLVDTLRDPEVQRSIRDAGKRITQFAENIANSPAAKALAAYANSPAAKRIAEYMDSPAYKRITEYMDSPAFKRTAELLNSPAMENMRKNIERMQRPAHLHLPPKR